MHILLGIYMAAGCVANRWYRGVIGHRLPKDRKCKASTTCENRLGGGKRGPSCTTLPGAALLPALLALNGKGRLKRSCDVLRYGDRSLCQRCYAPTRVTTIARVKRWPYATTNGTARLGTCTPPRWLMGRSRQCPLPRQRTVSTRGAAGCRPHLRVRLASPPRAPLR